MAHRVIDIFAGFWVQDGWTRGHDTEGRGAIRPVTVTGRTFYYNITAKVDRERNTRLEDEGMWRKKRAATARES